MARKNATPIWLWSRVGDVGNVQLLASVGVAFVSGAWAFVQGLPPLALFMVASGCFVISVYAILGMQNVFWVVHAQVQRAKCPLQIEDTIILELERLQDEEGKEIKDVYSVALYLYVSGKPSRHDTLQNVSARMSSWLTPILRLPCHESGAQKIDIRHGEHALFRIGSVLVPLVDGKLPGTHMFKRDAEKIDRQYAEHILVKQALQHRTLRTRDASGAEGGFGQVEGQKRFNIGITVSADDVSSLTAWYRLNLLDPDCRNWLERLKDKPDEHLSD